MAHVIEVKTLMQGRWTEMAVFADDDRMRAEPFEQIEIALNTLWIPE